MAPSSTPPEITTFFSDAEAQALLGRACVTCHDASRYNDVRYSPDRWRVSVVDMRERGAKITDEELERLQEGHLTYMDALRERGLMLANGPFTQKSDESLRGLCVMATGLDEARELMKQDPSVAAGRMAADVFEWLIPPRLASFGA